MKDTRPPGTLVPRFEINAGYSYINFNPGDEFNNFNNHGGTGGFTFNANRFLGLTAEVGGYTFKRELNGTNVDGGLTTYLFGPRLNFRKFDHFVPFAEFCSAAHMVADRLPAAWGRTSRWPRAAASTWCSPRVSPGGSRRLIT
jgi:hypothetical protein